nr:type II toxin-antitoxin system RelE/ParE family toxin [Ornithinimicrobium cryptoxanthini]
MAHIAADDQRHARVVSLALRRETCVNYSQHVVEVIRSATFDRGVTKLRDQRAAARVLIRINRLAAGNPDDVKPVGQGVSELRINYGPGYRIYYLHHGDQVVLLLTGGDSPPRMRTSARPT